MKIKPTLLGVLFMLTCAVFGQEFRQNVNGLIYSDKAIGGLKHIVDSLNLKFSRCEPRNFYSLVQQRATTVKLQGKQSLELKKAIEAGKTFDEVAKMLPDSVVHTDNLVIKTTLMRYDNVPVLAFTAFNTNGADDSIYFVGNDLEKYKDVIKGWVYDYREATEYSNENIFALYLDEPLKSSPLSERYSKLVQYSECLVDTSFTVFFKNVNDDGRRFAVDEKFEAFRQLAYKKLKRPEYNPPRVKNKHVIADTAAVYVDTAAVSVSDFNEKYYEVYSKKLNDWESTRLKNVKKLFKRDKAFRQEFYAICDLAKKGILTTDDEFEEYVALFVSPKEALWFKRNRIVVGSCSMDRSPRRHAMAIAELAGETAEWEIFLRAHLDIMNDRFQRVSDGSYAQGGRNTYIKELEVMDINVPDLLLGICLRVNDVSDNHYYGSVSRIGRSIAESRDRIVVKQLLLEMIKDDRLDDFNRLMMYYTLNSYVYSLPDAEEKKQERETLKLATLSMPEYIRPVSIGSD
jgi:hypothetical protein